ncbi:MAG: hypothetical protein MUQ10_05155, partial [Anaerolineae bacterium]|nr:hypothetical protein [Anaerolineae bacterium]
MRVEYWQLSWPKIRFPKGADVGAGREGWLAIDDWTNGRWQAADSEFSLGGNTLSISFHPVNAAEFPEEADFPAVFRRTIKLRLRVSGGQGNVEACHVNTDSVWCEAEFDLLWRSLDGEPESWNGSLAVFNGFPISIQTLTGATEITAPAAWRSRGAGAETGGIRARVRYAGNDDSNSYDRTIVTVRGGEKSFSFLVDDVLERGPIYLRDFGVLVSRADAELALPEFEAQWTARHEQTLYQRIHDLPEQTWERAWADMPAKRRFYFVLGCEGSRQKFGVDPTGDIFLGENFIRRVPGKDTARLGWEGAELRYRFGFPDVEPGDRSILDGYLPVIHTVWEDCGLCYEQEAYATWLFGDMLKERMAGDDPVVAMLRVTMTNLGNSPAVASLPWTAIVDGDKAQRLELGDGLVRALGPDAERLCYAFDTEGQGQLVQEADQPVYRLTLAPGSSHTIYLKLPFVDLVTDEEIQRLRRLSYPEERGRVVEFWCGRIAQGTQIETPNRTLNNFFRSHLMHMLVINDREPGSDRNVARCGGFHYGSFPDEGCMAISDLDRRGYTQEAENCLELYVHYQGTAPLPGNFKSAEGVLYGSGGYEVSGYNRNQGWVLWCLAEHYKYTRDVEWLQRVGLVLVKGCDWITTERTETMIAQPGGGRPIDYGFLPTGSLEDVTDYWTWLSTNAYAYLGMYSAAGVLAEIGHPQAKRLQSDADAYGADLRAGFFEACIRSPVVKLRDGTWVPHFPDRQQRRGRDFGWLREVLEGAAHLVYCGIVDPSEPAARWIIEDYEDNLFLSGQYGYPAPDFEQQWFSWGGFSMQPNLLIFPLLYLMRDEPKHYLRSYFNPFAAAFYPDTVMLTEHSLPTLADWKGDHFKSSDEALSTWWLRLMFLAEHGDELFVGQAIPREWFGDGQTMRVERAQTHFGEVSLEIISEVATGTVRVELSPPLRNAPERICLRVRHPDCRPMKAVYIDGLPY